MIDKSKIKRSYKSVSSVILRYFQQYGGWDAVFTSPYFHAALILSILSFPYNDHKEVWSLPVSVIPNVLGFSLGGYAVFLAFGDDTFKKLLAERNPDQQNKVSPYLSFSVSFLHFVIVQSLALLLGILGTNTYPIFEGCWIREAFVFIFAMLTYLIFLYSILSAIAAIFALNRLVFMHDSYLNVEAKKSKPCLDKEI